MRADVYLADPDITLYLGDALETLRGLPDESVHCVVTSPPYWGLRDYGTGLWDGGDPDCDHKKGGDPALHVDGSGNLNRSNTNWDHRHDTYHDVCGKCGAHRTDNQMGLEPTPELYVQNMVTVFREVRRVLRRDGTCWLNIGDSYNANQGAGFNANHHRKREYARRVEADLATPSRRGVTKPKDLVGIPWRLAFALQQDGWWLRADIIWAKPNPMPESVTDRPTKAHEYVFLLTRSPRYYYDNDAIREPHTARNIQQQNSAPKDRGDSRGFRAQGLHDYLNPAGRNVRSVWEIATEPFAAAHFATFPTELARRCILAGTSERGCCPECGAPWVREVERERVPTRPGANAKGRANADRNDANIPLRPELKVTTLGWRPTCEHRHNEGGKLGRPRRRPPDQTTPHSATEWLPGCEHAPDPVPCTVLDPFAGACTVPHVARRHGRHSIGIELSETYLRQIALPRLQQLSLLAESVPATEGSS